MTGLGAGDPDCAREGRQRNLDTGSEFRHLAIEVEVEVLDLPLREAVRELAEHAWHVEIRGVGARHDLVDAHLEHVARLSAFDVHWPCQSMGTATRIIGPQLLDLVDRSAWHDLVVRMHHRLEQDRITRLDVQHGRLGIVEPAPLGGIAGGGQHVHGAGITFGGEDAQPLLLGRRGWREWNGRSGRSRALLRG